MSRVKNPVAPAGVEVSIDANAISLSRVRSVPWRSRCIRPSRSSAAKLVFSAPPLKALSTARPCPARCVLLVNNMVTGVSKGFERKLTLVGVGYRAQARATS